MARGLTAAVGGRTDFNPELVRVYETDRIYLMLRPVNYLIDVPIFYAHFVQEARVDVGPHASDPVRFRPTTPRRRRHPSAGHRTDG